MEKQKLMELRGKARLLEPVVRIGKNGLTDSAVLHIKKMVRNQGLVKVKFLRSFVESNDRKKAAFELAERTGSELVEQVGFVVVLYKRAGAQNATQYPAISP